MFDLVIAGMIHNAVADTWHPVFFRDAPMPGPSPTVRRVKSKMHHTGGFKTRDEAIASIRTDDRVSDIPFDETYIHEWDGEGIPALIAFVYEGKRLVNL